MQYAADHLGRAVLCWSSLEGVLPIILRVFFQAVCVLWHYSDAVDRVVWKTLHKSGAEFYTIIPNILTVAELRHYQNITLLQPGNTHTHFACKNKIILCKLSFRFVFSISTLFSVYMSWIRLESVPSPLWSDLCVCTIVPL